MLRGALVGGAGCGVIQTMLVSDMKKFSTSSAGMKHMCAAGVKRSQ